MKMLLVTPSPANCAHFAEALAAQEAERLLRASQPAEALGIIAQEKPELVIVDETLREQSAKEFIRQVVMLNAFIYVAVLSGMPDEEFHEAYEGLGILAQLPARPGRKEAVQLLETYRRVAGAA